MLLELASSDLLVRHLRSTRKGECGVSECEGSAT